MSDLERTIAERLFDAHHAEGELGDALEKAGVDFERLGWDYYDTSLEIYDVPSDHRLGGEALLAISYAGFSRVFVNHQDKWETHYSFKDGVPPQETKGWRVSYPRKREGNESGIWVEEDVPGWPRDWFETGYVIIKPPKALP